MLPSYPWLDQSQSIGSVVINTGWRDLIERLLADIDSVLAGTSAVLVEHQTKEKLGTLRFYRRFRNASDLQVAKVAELVRRAEDESSRTCLVCGAPGILEWRGNWIAPLCDEHTDVESF